jgi:uncharacterized protein (TIGR01732 family)
VSESKYSSILKGGVRNMCRYGGYGYGGGEYGGGYGGGFALIIVLFILLIIVGAAFMHHY